MDIITIVFIAAIFALILAFFYSRQVNAIDVKVGSTDEEYKKMIKISSAIREGAMTFLKVEYKYISVFMLIFFVLLTFLLDHPETSINDGLYTGIAFLLGGFISLLAGYNGMRIAVEGNFRTAHAARESLAKAFDVSFKSGSVMGFALVGMALIGLAGLIVVYQNILPADISKYLLMEIIAGYGLGGSSIALFCRVGGGIYTKAADVGADLSGKVENSIPEDDPRNPAVIADNVGDNVGDIAGMGADLFGSCAEATCAALVIGASSSGIAGNMNALLFPILITAVGIPMSFITSLFAKAKTGEEVEGVLKNQILISTLLMVVSMYFVTDYFFIDSFTLGTQLITKWGVYYALISGLISGLLIGYVTEYFTSHAYKPVREVSEASKTGAATNIIYGLALGYNSSVFPVLFLSITIIIGYNFAGMYGIAIAAIGMISTLATALTIDAYGPVADNAGGIAEMTELGDDIRERTDMLDAAGNTTAAIGKGFAIGSAALTSLALFSAFITLSNVKSVELLDPWVIGSLVFGAMLPSWFTAMTMKSVGKAALDMVEEVRRQFKTIPGILEGTVDPDYKKCVDISTQAALREMINPGILVIATPILVGYLFGVKSLAGVLAGALAAGVVLAISSANSGGGWDNAKKYIEKGDLGEGFKKGSDAHKAAVVGDTVGDPFKDTSGPSINILIKLMAIISLVFATAFANHGGLLMSFFK